MHNRGRRGPPGHRRTRQSLSAPGDGLGSPRPKVPLATPLARLTFDRSQTKGRAVADASVDDLCFTPAVDLADMVRRRELSPVELVGALLDRIERVEPAVNAFVTLLDEQARTQAQATARDVIKRPVEELGPLHGVPVSIKDLTPTKGVRTTFGSVHFKDHVPRRDAPIVSRIRDAGAILLD